jgi:hypothetical protein
MTMGFSGYRFLLTWEAPIRLEMSMEIDCVAYHNCTISHLIDG